MKIIIKRSISREKNQIGILFGLKIELKFAPIEKKEEVFVGFKENDKIILAQHTLNEIMRNCEK